VIRTRPDSDAIATGDSSAYAAKLHRVLKAASVEHRVVTYEYHYTTHFFHEDVVETHTAVVYRDDNDPSNPWWLMEDRLGKPVWVSGENLEDQLAFYIRNQENSVNEKVNVVNEKDFPANGDHKDTLAIAHSATGYKYAGASQPVRFRFKPAPNYFEIAAALPQPAAQKRKYGALFRSVYGRAYHPSSAVDRRKMAILQNDASRHRRPLASQTY
jgi:hypothetical protein